MSIVKMKKLRIVVLRQQRDELMQALMRLGCVQVTEPEGMLSDPDAAALLMPERANLPRLRTEQSELNAALKVLAQCAPEKKKLLSARPEVSESDFLDGDALKADLALAESINERDSRVRRIAAEESRIRTEIESLRPWEPLDLPLNDAGTKFCAVGLVSAITQIEPESVRAAAESVTEAVQLVAVSDDETQRCYVAVALKEELPAVMDAIRAIGGTQVTFPGVEGTAKENIEWLEQQLTELGAEKAELLESLRAEGGRAAALRLSADRMAAEVAKAESIERMRGVGSVVVLEGWCSVPELGKLAETLSGFDCAWETEDPAEEEYPEVPVKLENKRFVRPMNLITEMYSMPAYDGIDPNPLMWPFFVLFYGIMMADMGYGILMMLASVIAVKSMKPRGGTGHLLRLLGMCGISTFVFGALTGGFFGDLLPQAAKLINPGTTFTALPSLFTPMNDIMAILVGSIALGVVQIFTGMTVSVVHKCKNGEVLSAVFSEGAWWCILIGAALAILKLGSWLLIVGGVLLVVGQFYEKKSLPGALMGLFGSIYNGVTGYLSDILSYLRLMALMLSGSVIAMVFNTLGAMTGNVVLFLVIAMCGNMLNFALNLIGCFVHDLRLQVLEFFSRFYKDGGKPYKPLNIDPQYVDIIKEEI
ncbi:MAG: V-type ATP synthase subunit I [Oscillospiraceae bacterium]